MPSISLRSLLMIGTAIALSACQANRYCARPQAYESAPSIPPLVGSDTLRIPTTPTALKVPDAKGDSLTFGYGVPDPAHPGKSRIECLDRPPPIPPLADSAK